jgi:ribosomal-protein-alanine N-acetyltransferase
MIMMNNYVIRRMTLNDLDRICDIEQSAFSLPWSRESFHNELNSNHFSYYLVLEVNGLVIGYGGMWIILDEAHITNIAIEPAYRGQKWGERLLLSMQLHAFRYGAESMTLEVRKSNKVAQGLYEKLGFTTKGIRPRYYSDNGEDALIMWVTLKDETTEEQMETKSS